MRQSYWISVIYFIFILDKWEDAIEFCNGRRKGIPPTVYADCLVRAAFRERIISESDDEEIHQLTGSSADQAAAMNNDATVSSIDMSLSAEQSGLDESLSWENESVEPETPSGILPHVYANCVVMDKVRNRTSSESTDSSAQSTNIHNDSTVNSVDITLDGENSGRDQSLNLEKVEVPGAPDVKIELEELRFNRNDEGNDELFVTLLDDSMVELPANESGNNSETSDDDDDEIQVAAGPNGFPKPFVITDDIYCLLKRENDIFSGNIPYNEKV